MIRFVINGGESVINCGEGDERRVCDEFRGM